MCLFLMLNPGTESGNEKRSHRTRNKCTAFAAKWGYSMLWTCNLFAIGGASPEAALSLPNPIGPHNDRHITQVMQCANQVVCAWGSARRDQDKRRTRVRDVVRMLDHEDLTNKMRRLDSLTAGGQPRHPLGRGEHNLPLDTPLVPFTNEELEMLKRYGRASV